MKNAVLTPARVIPASDIIKCMVCSEQTDGNMRSHFVEHPRLKILCCEKCEKGLSGEWSKSEDGSDKYCSWCGEGGYLYMCDKCEKRSFCKRCLQRFIGRGYKEVVENEDGWSCFICDPTPLRSLQEQCRLVLDEQKVVETIRPMDKRIKARRSLGKRKCQDRQEIREESGNSAEPPLTAENLAQYLPDIIDEARAFSTRFQGIIGQMSSNLEAISEHHRQGQKKIPAALVIAERLKNVTFMMKEFCESNADADVPSSGNGADTPLDDFRDDQHEEEEDQENGIDTAIGIFRDDDVDADDEREEVEDEDDISRCSGSGPRKRRLSLSPVTDASKRGRQISDDHDDESTSVVSVVYLSSPINESGDVSMGEEDDDVSTQAKEQSASSSNESVASPDSADEISSQLEDGFDPEVEKEISRLRRIAKWKLTETKPRSRRKQTEENESDIEAAASVQDHGVEHSTNSSPVSADGEELFSQPRQFEYDPTQTIADLVDFDEYLFKNSPNFSDYDEASVPLAVSIVETNATGLPSDEGLAPETNPVNDVVAPLEEKLFASRNDEVDMGAVDNRPRDDDHLIITLSSDSDDQEDLKPVPKSREELKIDRLLGLSIRPPNENSGKRSSQGKKKRRTNLTREYVVLTSSSDEETDGGGSDYEANEQSANESSDGDSDSDTSGHGGGNDDELDLEQEILSQESSSCCSPSKGRRNIRPILDGSQSTLEAEAAERARCERLAKSKSDVVVLNQSGEGPSTAVDQLAVILDGEATPPVVIHPSLVKELKSHQIDGVKFLYTSTIESVARLNRPPGGCILAHCMGLGKTFQVIAYLQSVLFHSSLKLTTALVVAPVNVVLGWKEEFVKWLRHCPGFRVYVYSSSCSCSLKDRLAVIKQWEHDGGVFIISHQTFRNLIEQADGLAHMTTKAGKSMQKLDDDDKMVVTRALVDPGPNIIVCDEAHTLKNDETMLYNAMNLVKTKRRICLTGTPLQNNLSEYHRMIQFVKPKLLGSSNEFRNRFENPISNGQCLNSTAYDVRLMKNRAHVLHETLKGCVHRLDYSVLRPVLPPRYEYVLMVRLSEKQTELYNSYLKNIVGNNQSIKRLFTDFSALQRICLHPLALKRHAEKKKKNPRRLTTAVEPRRSQAIVAPDENNQGPSDPGNAENSFGVYGVLLAEDTSVADRTVQQGDGGDGVDWWKDLIADEDFNELDVSGKTLLLMEILWKCEMKGDKVIVFSQSLLTLDVIEQLLKQYKTFIDVYHSSTEVDKGHIAHRRKRRWAWKLGWDYFRLDGHTPANKRKSDIKAFNDANPRGRLFLVSTKAGGVGTNMVGANRIVLMDVCFNPAVDCQAGFRAYRYGQTKPVYIYRLVSQGTMEDVIYNRQVSKQSLALRVVDEHQIDRYFNTSDLAELYQFNGANNRRSIGKANLPSSAVPKDDVLGNLLLDQARCLDTYHEHDSLLQDKEEEKLTEEEKKAAWAEFKAESVPVGETLLRFMNESPELKEAITRCDELIARKHPGQPSTSAFCCGLISQNRQLQAADLLKGVMAYWSELTRICFMQTPRAQSQQPLSQRPSASQMTSPA